MFVVNLTALFKNNKRDHSARSCIAGSPELRKRRRPTKRKRTGSFLTDYSTRKGRIVSQTNAGTVSKAALETETSGSSWILTSCQQHRVTSGICGGRDRADTLEVVVVVAFLLLLLLLLLLYDRSLSYSTILCSCAQSLRSCRV